MATLLETVMRKYSIPCRIFLNQDITKWSKPNSFEFYIDIISQISKQGIIKTFYIGNYSLSRHSIQISSVNTNQTLYIYNDKLRMDTNGNIYYLTYSVVRLLPIIDLKDIPRFFKKLLTQSCFKTPISNMNEFIGAIHQCRAEIIHDILSPQELTKVGQYIRKSHE